jgi:ABC-type uncharacterized transport system fused permease/ATPase subunit
VFEAKEKASVWVVVCVSMFVGDSDSCPLRTVLLIVPSLQRITHIHVTAEAIAFYNGGDREERIARGRLMSLVDIARLRILWSAALELWTTYYTWATFLVPSVLTAPRYFSGEIEFGVITQARIYYALHVLSCLVFL